MIYIVADTHSRNIEFKSNPDDLLIHLGDWEQGEIKTSAKKVLVRGDHDIMPTNNWDLVVDGLLLNKIWFSHIPVFKLPAGATRNIFGHLHTGRIDEFGYDKKEWHFWLPPNEVHELEKFMFEAKEKNNIETQRALI